MTTDFGPELSAAEARILRRAAGIIIPASEAFGVPGAEAAAAAVLGRDDRVSAALGRVVLQCYYRDDRVLEALGLEARAPYPKGHVVEQGDWSLLDRVRERAPLWRDDRRA
jgi:hypothetical protein